MSDKNLDKIAETLEKHFDKLRKMKNVLNLGMGTKFTNGRDTGRPSIIVFVAKKQPLIQLNPEDVIPQFLDEVYVDVVELSTTDYELGHTNPSRLSPSIQRKIASGVKNEQKRP